MKIHWIAFLFFILLLPVAWLLFVRLEGKGPLFEMEPALRFIGKSQKMGVTVSDPGSGLRRVRIDLSLDGREFLLLEKEYPEPGFFRSKGFSGERLDLEIEPARLGIPDGEAILRLSAWDRSWRNWWGGNRTLLETPVSVDTRPPGIDVLTPAHYLNQGGAGLIVYRLSEPCPEHGVLVGDRFFPGQAGYFADERIVLALFALTHEQGPGTEIAVTAADAAENRTRRGFPHHIRKKVFKKDTLRISDQFLEQKMPEFGDGGPGGPAVDRFLWVNRDLRQADFRKISEIGKKSDAALHWEGVFLRLPNAAPMAGFADHRTYTYKGNKIDEQTHLGIDLASLARSPVPASNRGRVAFAGEMGIYGITVVIDHGLGLFSMYSHLSQTAVEAGQMVEKGHIVGNTGSTGLAGGDHLHFAMLVRDTFVNPIEWWDAAWIENNITGKIRSIGSTRNQE